MISFFFLMIRRPPRSTLDRSSAASDVYKRQTATYWSLHVRPESDGDLAALGEQGDVRAVVRARQVDAGDGRVGPVSYTHLRAHETVLDLVCRLLLEKKKQHTTDAQLIATTRCRPGVIYTRATV